MWWLVGFLAALAAASSNSSRNSRAATGSPVDEAGAVTYRSRDGSAFFRFRFTYLGNDLRIDVLEFPHSHLGSCHIPRDGAGPQVCWSGPITGVAAARAVAAMWAEATLVYQRTGRSF
jgi:hypothetical protein